MNKKILKNIVLFLLLTGYFFSCSNDMDSDTEKTALFDVYCFEDGCCLLRYRTEPDDWPDSAVHYHSAFFQPDKLPDKYKIQGLRLYVTYCDTDLMGNCNSPVLHIIKIKKQKR